MMLSNQPNHQKRKRRGESRPLSWFTVSTAAVIVALLSITLFASVGSTEATDLVQQKIQQQQQDQQYIQHSEQGTSEDGDEPENDEGEFESGASGSSAGASSGGGSGASNNSNKRENVRLWGAAAAAAASVNGASSTGTGSGSDHSVHYSPHHHHHSSSSSPRGSGAGVGAAIGENATTPTSQPHLPFVATTKQQSAGVVTPPEGFSISARVYIDSADKLSHFDDLSAAPITLPYWDCGIAGTTTAALALKDAFFRHALYASGSKSSTTWSGYGESGQELHPVLAVALTPIQVDLNSGETQAFQAGDVILLEDVLLPGHKIRPLPEQQQHDLQVLFLTLPQKHHHTGKEYLSLRQALTKDPSTRKPTSRYYAQQEDPCQNLIPPFPPSSPASASQSSQSRLFRSPPSTLDSDQTSAVWGVQSSDDNINKAVTRRSSSPHKIRLTALSVFGFSLSLLAADFLGKTAPLWLAVAVGGTCFVAGGTLAFVKTGDYLVTALELWQEQRSLRMSSQQKNARYKGDGDPDNDDETEEEENTDSSIGADMKTQSTTTGEEDPNEVEGKGTIVGKNDNVDFGAEEDEEEEEYGESTTAKQPQLKEDILVD